MAILFFAQTAIFCRFCTLKLRYFADFTLSNCDILHNKPHHTPYCNDTFRQLQERSPVVLGLRYARSYSVAARMNAPNTLPSV